MKEKNLLLSIGINIVITLAEIVVGVFIGSLAIISDAVHNFFDVGSMVLSLFGERMSEKKGDTQKTYGYKRVEVLMALLNSTILLISTGVIGYEAIGRLFNPHQVQGNWMLIMALMAFAGNLLATKLLHEHSEESLNLKAAFLHSFQDALFSAGVIVAAILVLVFNWQWADAGITLILAIFLVKEAISLILETINILMEGVPSELDMEKLKQDILNIKGIISIDDIHAWNTGSKDIILTAHVVAEMKNDMDYLEKFKSIQKIICKNHGISHTTIQLVSNTIKDELKNIYKHCG